MCRVVHRYKGIRSYSRNIYSRLFVLLLNIYPNPKATGIAAKVSILYYFSSVFLHMFEIFV